MGGGVVGAPRRSGRRLGGKSLPQTGRDVQEFFSHHEEQSGGFRSRLNLQTSVQRAPQTKVAQGPESGASTTSPPALTASALLFLLTPHPLLALGPSCATLLAGRRSPRACAGSPGGRSRLELTTALQRRGLLQPTSLVRACWGASELSLFAVSLGV